MKTRIDYSRAFTLIISLLAAGVSLLALIGLTGGVIPVAAAAAQVDAVCYATPDDGGTVYDSADSADALRQAVAAASAGGEVWVAGTCPGVVAESGTNQVLLLDKDLTLIGYTYASNTWQYVPQDRATLDAENGGRVIRIVGEVDVLLDNLRLINGQTSAPTAHGAGVAADDATLTISKSVFADNDAAGNGGGVYATRPLALINTAFLSNTASSGGGVSTRGTAQVNDGRFENNQSESTGGAITTYRSLTISGTHFISNTAAGSRAGAVLSRAAGDDTLIITNAHFEENQCTYAPGCAGGALFAYNPVVVTGSTFTGNRATGTGFASGGGAIYALAEIDIRGSILQENETHAHGGAIYAQAPMTLQDSEVVQNKSGRDGGGIWNSGVLVVENVLIAANNSTENNYNGGGIYNSGSLSLESSQVISNVARSSGGIHNVEGASVTIQDALFRANRATGNFGSGGGVRNQGIMAVENTVFEANDGSSGGGGIANDGELTATEVDFLDNVADSAGALNNSGDATISNALFEGNTATGVLTELREPGGGAVRNNSFGSLTITDSTVRDNHATYRGGAFYNSGSFGSVLSLINTTVISNAAESGGGFYLVGDVTVEASRIFSNSASTVGGGLTIADGGDVTLQNNFIAGNSATRGDAVYFNDTGEEDSRLAATHNTFVGSAPAGSGTAIESAAAGSHQEVSLTNVIVSDYAVGVQLGGITDTAIIDGILWHEVDTNTSGGIFTVTHAYTGTPQFVNPSSANYHIQPASIAVDHGVATPVDRDIDFEPRPIGAAPDLGADEVGTDEDGLGNYVWQDSNDNGLQDASEPGIPSVTVRLLDDNGQVLDTTTTNDAGYYFFPLGTAGEYQIEFVPPADYLFTRANRGDNDANDSDADPATGLTPLFSFAGDTIDHTWDAGLSSTLPDLFIRKQASETFIDPGQRLSYELTFGNQGAGVAYNVVITDMVPIDLLTDITYEVEGIVVTPTTGMTYTWDVAPLAAGSEGSIVIRGTVRQGLSAGTSIENMATIASSADEETPADNSDDVLVTVADAPPIAYDDSGFGFTTSPGVVFTTANVLANDREPNGERLTLVSVNTSGLQGQLINNGDGTFTYDPAGAFDYVDTGRTATDVFSYTVSDEGGNTDTATVTITIQGEGHALFLPIIMRDAAVRANRPSLPDNS